MKPSLGVLILIVSILFSTIIANLPTDQDPGLGGLILLFWPPIVGIIAIAAFLITSVLTKNIRTRMIVLICLSLYLIYLGIGLHVDKGWPMIYW